MVLQDQLDEINWINNYLGRAKIIDPEQIKSILYFSLIWNLFEGQICSQDFKYEKVKRFVDKLHENHKLQAMDFGNHFNYFRCRYVQGNSTNELFKKLFPATRNYEYKEFVEKVITADTPNALPDIVKALVLIAYRFRNNLFHGTKSLFELDKQVGNFEHLNQFLITLIELKQNG